MRGAQPADSSSGRSLTPLHPLLWQHICSALFPPGAEQQCVTSLWGSFCQRTPHGPTQDFPSTVYQSKALPTNPPSPSPFTGVRPAHVLKAFPAYSCLLPLSFTSLSLSRSLACLTSSWCLLLGGPKLTQPLRYTLLPTIAAETLWLWECPVFCGKTLLFLISSFGAQGTFSSFLVQPQCFLQLFVLQGWK